MSPQTRSKQQKKSGVKPTLVKQIQDATVSKKKNKETLPDPKVPPPKAPVSNNTAEDMEIEESSNDTPSQEPSTSTVPPPSPTAAQKGKDKEIEQIPEFQPTAATIVPPPEETNNPPPIDDALYEKITRRTSHK